MITKKMGLVILLIVAFQVHATGLPEDLARQWCADCHGVDGNSTSPLFPRLAGQQHDYLVGQLQAFRAKSRSNQGARDYMWGMSSTIDDASIDGLATYFTAQKPQANPSSASPALLAAGEQLFKNGHQESGTPACAACHGAQAEGTAIAPRLAGQHAEYLAKQLKIFETNERPAAVAMHGIVMTLSKSDIGAVTAYLQNLQ